MGGTPLRCDVELHTTHLDRVLEHSQADMVVSVEAGITLEALQEELGKAGQFLPLDPFNSPGHTIGGLLATGWSGPLRQRFGSARDYLIGIRVAMPDGHLASAERVRPDEASLRRDGIAGRHRRRLVQSLSKTTA